ncbi:ABC transporter ATP-binding protein [Roseovarius aestuarii]|nr:ABC transporter ATP-binding protein [Roseovarius aestuarii]
MTAANLDVSLPMPQSPLQFLTPGRATIDILRDISLTIDAKTTLGLVGESGSGKSTLARALLGLQPISGGEICFDQVPLTTPAGFQSLRRSTAMMFQDPIASLSPRMRIGKQLTEPFVIHRVVMPDRGARAAQLLDRVGLPASLADRYPHELSGGQARRVCVARALALSPRLLIADEPTAGLDVSVQGEILNLLRQIRDETGLALLIITHNLPMVRHVSDHVAIMYLGRLIETGPTRTVFANPKHPYTQNLIASKPQPDPRKRRSDLAIKGEIPSILRRPEGCEFHNRCRFAQDLCRQHPPELREVSAGQFARCHYAETLTK